MNLHKLLIILFLINLNFLSALTIIEIYTYDILPPYAFRNEEGQLSGIYIDIVKEAISKMENYELSFRVVPWARAKDMVKKGKAFAILPPYFHAHDWLTDDPPYKPYIWPYSLPLYTQADVIIGNKRRFNNSRKIFPEEYRDLSFVMFRGDGRAGVKFTKMVKEGKIKLHEVNDLETCIKMLLAGRYDCTITSRIPFAWKLNQMKKNGKLRNYNPDNLKEFTVISENNGYLGYTDIDCEHNFPYKKDFSVKFDIQINRMYKTGKI